MDYGEMIARRRARAKAKSRASVSEAKTASASRRKNPTRFKFYPMRDESVSPMPGLDWSRASTVETAQVLCEMMEDPAKPPLMPLLKMPPGTGKTAIGVMAIGLLQERLGEPLNVVLIMPGAIRDKKGWQRTITSWNEAHPDNVIDPLMIDTPDRFSNILRNKQTYATVVKALGSKGLIVLDEAHKYKNPTSVRSKQLQKLPHVRRLGLTATPLSVDIPVETGSYLILGGYYKNKTRYMEETGLGKRIGFDGSLMVYDPDTGRIDTGLWPEYETVKKQRQEMFVVPDVSFVLKDMPDVDTHLMQIPQSDDLDADIRSLGRAYHKRMFDSAGELTLAITERILVDEARLDTLTSLVKSHEGEQPLIFYWHVAARDAIASRFASEGIEWQEVSGSSSVRDVDESDTSRPILIQYLAGSEGIEFKSSRVSIFYENQGSPIVTEQARGRNVRLGTKHRLSHYYLVADTFYDQNVFARAQRGEELTEEIYEEIALAAID